MAVNSTLTARDVESATNFMNRIVVASSTTDGVMDAYTVMFLTTLIQCIGTIASNYGLKFTIENGTINIS